ncbi:methyltransferase RsmF C-terminal domain-like protein [Duncaniella muris]|jgi:16S rRNA C967 or C1407 C5-methylase (RsmB/RsmF family)/NOL1/NOP2/fmu family ribosome biogenesis protein|uniref:methyltransferase RsmF C-terminal domain-like protein n=1 Tax=Duncaniella muris TaxID=2094150 RepID=UPI0026748490|nr:hypothetical protein [Duncaniella muris]
MDRRILPEIFLEKLKEMNLTQLGDALAEGEPCVSVRLNASKNVSAAEVPEICAEVPWCRNGFYLDRRPRFTFDPLLHQGGYYVQEASSMFHSHVVSQLCKDSGLPLRVLDSCAAPGGKTTAAIDSLPEGSLTVANEYVPSRAAVLRENLIKWSSPFTVVTRGDTAAFRRLKNSFDMIIADVPCSGEGMMRKDPEAIAQWSEGLVSECAERQWMIISNLWPSLKPGGFLIYSTCTFNRLENEEMVSRIIEELGAESVAVDVDPEWGIAPGISTPHHCYRFMPDRLKGEGLFVAVVRKEGEWKPFSPDTPAKQQKAKGKGKSGRTQIPKEAAGWIDSLWAEKVTLYAENDRISAFPAAHMDLLGKLKGEIDVIHEGIPLATVKGRDLIPSQPLALSPLLSQSAFPTADISRDEALAYLSGDAVTLPDDTPCGFVLLRYSGRPLGFVKNLGRRSNNLYPAPWRIKSKL